MKPSKRVLLIQPVPSTIGGVDSLLLRMIRQARLQASDYSFVVALPPGSPYVPIYQNEGAQVETVPMSFFWKGKKISDFVGMAAPFPSSFWRLCRIIRSHRIDLVHSHKINVLVGDLAAVATGRIAVHSFHEVNTGGLFTYRALSRVILALTSAVVITCDATGELIASDWQQRPDVHKIYTGIDVNEYHARRIGKAEACAALGVPADRPVVSVLARFQDTKGIEYFLAAIPRILRHHPSTTFLVVGDIAGPEPQLLEYKKRLLQLVDELGIAGACRFAGAHRDVVAALSATDIQVLPSVFDVLPNVIFEAMSMSLPIVGTRVGGVHEQLEDGVTGYVVPPRDADAIADRVCLLLSDPEKARAMGRAGRERVARLFSVETYTQSMLDLYDRTLAGTARSRVAV